MYIIDVKKDKKLFMVTAEGIFTKNEGENLLKELQDSVKSITPSQYCLVLDVVNIMPAPQDSLEIMAKVNEFYMITPFGERFCIASKSLIANYQINRVTNAKEAMKFVESFEEVEAQRSK